MSLITANTLESVRRTQAAYTLDVITNQLRKGLAPVIDRNPREGIAITWAFAPNDPAFGLGFHARDRNRNEVEGVPVFVPEDWHRS